MALEMSMSGSGTLGEILPGWNISEYATPHTLGEYAGGTGTVNFTAKANSDSLFVLNNNIITAESTIGDSMSGYINSVSQTGSAVSITHSNQLAIYDAERFIPPVLARDAVSAVDLCTQLAGKPSLTKANGTFYSLAGHDSGFSNEVIKAGVNPVYKPVLENPEYNYYLNDGVDVTENYENFVTSYGGGFSFNATSGKMYANVARGDTFSVSGNNRSTVAYKTFGNSNFNFGTKSRVGGVRLDSEFTIDVDYATATVTITAHTLFNTSLSIPGTTNTTSASLTGSLSADEEYVLFITYMRDYGFSVAMCSASDYFYDTCYTSVAVPTLSAYNSRPWFINGTVRAVWTSYDTATNSAGNLELTPSEYEAVNYNYVTSRSTAEMNYPIAGVRKNMWQYIQDACVACGQEVAIVNDVVTVRWSAQQSENIIDITNIVGAPTVSPASTLTGRAVNIEYTNSEYIVSDEIYNAYTENADVITVEAGKINSVKVQTNSYFTFIYPMEYDSAYSFPAALGTYSVSDTNGLPVGAGTEWLDYGGSLTVSIDEEDPTILNVTVIGPRINIPGHDGPYKIAISDGNKDFPALSVWGTGVKKNPNTLSLITSVDPIKVSQNVSSTISNPFIVNLTQAYDSGISASIVASGPNVTFSGTIPISAVNGLGLTPGGIVKYNNSKYRIVDVSINNIGISFNASRYVTVNSFENSWALKTVQYHDFEWSNYETQDHFIAPLMFETGQIYVFTDTDSVPYFNDVSDDAYSILIDTDGNPYIEYTENDPNSILLYLDNDFVPYY